MDEIHQWKHGNRFNLIYDIYKHVDNSDKGKQNRSFNLIYNIYKLELKPDYVYFEAVLI